MYDKEVHPFGEALPTDQCVFRMKVISTFVKAGVPLNIRLTYYGMLWRKVATG